MYIRGWSSSLLYLCLKHPIVAVLTVALCIALPCAPWRRTADGEFCGPFGIVTLAFDDGYKSVIENAFPIMERYGYKGIAYVIPRLIGQPGYMHWEDLRFLQRKGWEIGSHSLTHPYLPGLTTDEIHFELTKSKQILEEQGLTIRHFSSPYGEYDERVLEFAARYYDSHRTSWPPDLNDIPLSDPEDRYLIKAIAVDELTLDEVKQWIVRAKQENKWLVLIFHRIGEEGTYNQSLEEFEEILSFLAENDFRQFPPDFVISESFFCKDIPEIWPNLRILFSPSMRADNRTSLLFAVDWQGEGEICFKSLEVIVYNEEGRQVSRNRIPWPFICGQGTSCFEILARPMKTGNYSLVIFIEDRHGLSWKAEFLFSLGATCARSIP